MILLLRAIEAQRWSKVIEHRGGDGADLLRHFWLASGYSSPHRHFGNLGGSLHNVALGFSVALTPINLLFCFLGSLVGTLVGVLPGLGPVGAVAFLLSLTFKMEPASAIIMLAGIYYGAMYGGSTTSILVNIPGETASVVTCLDGYRWRAKAARARRWASPPSARLSPEPSA